MPPIGTIESPVVDYSPHAPDFGWGDDKHSDFLKLSLPRIWLWYEQIFDTNVPGFGEGILPFEME